MKVHLKIILVQGTRSYWYVVGNKTCYVLKVSKFYVEKGIYVNRLESPIFGL